MATPKAQKVSVTVDTEELSGQISQHTEEIATISSAGIMIYDAATFDETAALAKRAEEIEEKIVATFKPTEDAIKNVQKVLKATVDGLKDRVTKFKEEARKECEVWLRANPKADVQNGRIQGGKWKLIVKDEDALFKSMISVKRRKVDGVMTEFIELDPAIRSLFVYNEAKGNALAGALTTNCNLAGCEAKQSDHLTLSVKE